MTLTKDHVAAFAAWCDQVASRMREALAAWAETLKAWFAPLAGDLAAYFTTWRGYLAPHRMRVRVPAVAPGPYAGRALEPDPPRLSPRVTPPGDLSPIGRVITAPFTEDQPR